MDMASELRQLIINSVGSDEVDPSSFLRDARRFLQLSFTDTPNTGTTHCIAFWNP